MKRMHPPNLHKHFEIGPDELAVEYTDVAARTSKVVAEPANAAVRVLIVSTARSARHVSSRIARTADSIGTDARTRETAADRRNRSGRHRWLFRFRRAFAVSPWTLAR
jgi:hypothetical protein